MTAFVVAFCFLIIIDGLFVVGVADELFLVQSPVALVVLLLILVLGFCPVVGGALRGYFALQCHAVHFGYELAFGDYGVIVGIYLVDDAADLRADFHFRHRFDCSGGGDRFRYFASGYDSRFVGHFMLGLRAAKEPEACAGHNCNAYGDKNDFLLVHSAISSLLICFILTS